MRRVFVRGHENVRKRVLIQAAACNIGLLLRRQTGIGTPRSLQGRAFSAIFRLIDRLTPLGASNASLGPQMDTAGARRLNCSSPGGLNSRARRDFYLGLLDDAWRTLLVADNRCPIEVRRQRGTGDQTCL